MRRPAAAGGVQPVLTRRGPRPLHLHPAVRFQPEPAGPLPGLLARHAGGPRPARTPAAGLRPGLPVLPRRVRPAGRLRRRGPAPGGRRRHGGRAVAGARLAPRARRVLPGPAGRTHRVPAPGRPGLPAPGRARYPGRAAAPQRRRGLRGLQPPGLRGPRRVPARPGPRRLSLRRLHAGPALPGPPGAAARPVRRPAAGCAGPRSCRSWPWRSIWGSCTARCAKRRPSSART